MKRKTGILRKFIGVSAIFVIFLFSANFTFGQCGTYFKTGYRKIVNNFGDYNVEDWTGDGRPDFWKFQMNPNTSTQNVLVFANNGNGGFNWDNPVVYTTNITESSPSYSVLDFNGDGKRDFVSSRFVHQNNGNGTFTALTENFYPDEAGSPSVETVGFIDVTGDNILDWIKVNGVAGQGHSMNYRAGHADGTFSPRTDIITGVTIMNQFKVIGDFTGDGKKDIAYKYFTANSTFFRVLINNGNGTFTPGPETSATDIPYFPTVSDINNDGKADLVNGYGGTDSPYIRHLFVFTNNGDASFTKTELPVNQLANATYCTNCAEIKVADFNGDGFADIIEFVSAFYSVHLSNGSGGYVRSDYGKPYYSPYGLVLADFNGDNKTDFFVKIKYSSYMGNVFDEQVIIIQYNQCASFGETRSANFDGNHAPDLMRWNPNTGDWASINGRWLLATDSTVKTFNWGLGSLGDVPAPGDFDGDSKTDYAVYRDSTGYWYIRQSSNSGWYVLKFGLPGDIAVPNDYDGGGKTDIAVFRPSDGNWYFWSSETQQFSAVHFGLNGDKPVPADYDGDGKTDVAVFRPSEGNWYYLKSSDGNYVIYHWGISTDKPVPADYDGDGRADITVYRGGDWYVLRSSDDAFAFFHWGNANDFPIAVYDDGEIASPVVFRSTNWYWYNYAFESSAIFFGGTQNVPIYFGLPNN